MDVAVPQDVRCAAYGQAVWSCPANAGDKPVSQLAGAGGKKAGSPRRSRSSRKTIAQGVPDDFGVPVLASRAFSLFCTQGSGCVVHPAFPAPSSLEGATNRCTTRTRNRAAGMLLLVIASGAKQSILPLVALWIASSLALLAMTTVNDRH